MVRALVVLGVGPLFSSVNPLFLFAVVSHLSYYYYSRIVLMRESYVGSDALDPGSVSRINVSMG